MIPELPESLYQAARTGATKEYWGALMGYLRQNPASSEAMQFIVAKTLGNAIGSTHLSGLYAMFLARPQTAQEEAARAGFATGPDQGMNTCQAIIDHPEGLVVGIRSTDNNIGESATEDGKIHLYAQ